MTNPNGAHVILPEPPMQRILKTLLIPLLLSVSAFTEDLPKWAPWVEANTAAQVAGLLPGCREWAVSTDTICVTSEPNAAVAVYTQLAAALPGVKIIPGIKPNYPLQNDFGNLAGWTIVAQACQQSADLCHSTWVVLETETPTRNYTVHNKPLNMANFAAGLRKLPTTLNYIWYPTFDGNGGDVYNRQLQLVRIVAANIPAPRLRLCTMQYANTRTPGSSDFANFQRIAEQYAPCVDIAYFEPVPDYQYAWPNARLPEVLSACPRTVLPYPGQTHWSSSALGCGTALRVQAAADLVTARALTDQVRAQLATANARIAMLTTQLTMATQSLQQLQATYAALRATLAQIATLAATEPGTPVKPVDE